MYSISMLAAELLQAEDNGKPIELISKRFPTFSYDEAVAVHAEVTRSKIARGEILIGKKIGLTSKGMREQIGVFEPDFGNMFSPGFLPNGSDLICANLITPLVESEIAFILKEDLTGPIVLPSDVIRATAGVMPALEVVDTRFGVWKITIVDTVADSASSGKVILGNKMTPIDDLDLSLIGMASYKNGSLISTGSGAAVLGDPVVSVAWLANKMLHYGSCLKKGEIILSGALAGAIPIAAGDTFEAKFDRLGSASFRVV